MIRTIVMLAGLLLGLGHSYAQTVLSLEEAINIALESNYGIEAVRKSVAAAENNHHPGMAGLLPTVEASASYDRSLSALDLTIANFSDPGEGPRRVDEQGVNATNLSAGVNLRYPVFRGGQGRHTLQQLATVVSAEQIRLAATKEQLVVDVTSAYLDIIRLKSLRDIAEQAVLLSQEQYQRAARAFEFGGNNQLNVLQTEVDLRNDSIAMQDVGFQLTNAYRNLNLLLARSPNTSFSVEGQIILTDSLMDYQQLWQRAQSANTQLQLSQQQEQLSELDVSLAKARRYPEISLFTSYRYLDQQTDVGQLLSLQQLGPVAGIQVRQNVFDGLRTRKERENAQLNREQSKLEQQQVVLQLETELSNAYATYQHNRRQLNNAQTNLPVSERSYEKAEEDFRRGLISATTLREADLNLIRVQNQIVNFTYLLKVSEVQLFRLAGLL